MADVFLSYARVDHGRAAKLVAALREDGFDVWWDPKIQPGRAGVDPLLKH